jgi:TPR repeat protein
MFFTSITGAPQMEKSNITDNASRSAKEAFKQWADEDLLSCVGSQTNIKLTNGQSLCVAEIIESLWNCDDVMPDVLCNNLRMPLDSTYAQGVSELGSDLMASGSSPAFNKYCEDAEDGDAEAQFNFGLCFQKGRGVWKDYREAVSWYRKAAGQGNANAQYQLGACHEFGVGVEMDGRKAASWYRKAAGQGNTNAQALLGETYMSRTDCRKAVKWLRKAAERGNTYAQNNLGDYYSMDFIDIDIPKRDKRKAIKWYCMAADQGNAYAMFRVARCCADGRGIEKDMCKAFEWYLKAAEHGDTCAMSILDTCYACGDGVQQDELKAIAWRRKAEELKVRKEIIWRRKAKRREGCVMCGSLIKAFMHQDYKDRGLDREVDMGL